MTTKSWIGHLHGIIYNDLAEEITKYVRSTYTRSLPEERCGAG